MRSKIFLSVALMLLPLIASAEANWVFQLGGWYAKQYGGSNGVAYQYDYSDGQRTLLYDKSGAVTFATGLYLQIDLSHKLPLFLETGLGYRLKPVLCVEDGYKFDPNDKSVLESPDGYTYGCNGNFIELPVKAGYRLSLNEKNAFEFGLGPYMSYCFADGTEDYGDRFSVGATASVVFRHRCMSFGVSYTNPLFKNGLRDYHKNSFLFTIGINFGSSSWNNIGNAMLMAGQVMGTVAETYNTYSGGGSYSGGYNDGGSQYTPSSTRSGSPATNDKSFSASEQQAYKTDKNTYSRYETELSKHFYGGVNMSSSSVKQMQSNMKKLRKKWEARGKSWTKSPLEDR